MTEHFGDKHGDKHMSGQHFSRHSRRAVAIVAFGLLGAIGTAQAVDLDEKMQVCGACHATGAGALPSTAGRSTGRPALKKECRRCLKASAMECPAP